eukprot:jgi/Mesvir1/17705/Mv18987-RA.1
MPRIRPVKGLVDSHEVEFLMVKRGREPGKGVWAFPGGGLRLGETVVDCADREMREETGLALLRDTGGKQALSLPQPFTCVDSITYDDSNRVMFHYAIVEVAALPEDPNKVPVAGDDADEIQWMTTQEMVALLPDGKVAPGCPGVADLAISTFHL